MADDDEKPHDWDPDREKRQTDPVEMAKALAKAYGEEMRAQEAVREAQLPPPPPMDLQVRIHKISNGHVVLWGQAPAGYPNDHSSVQEVFAADSPEVHAVVLKLLREFFDGKLLRKGRGTPPGPFIGGGGPGLGPVEG